VDPTGQVLPCSSFQTGIGSLLDDRYEVLQAAPASQYWRDKRFVPPVCADCPDVDLCAGACPLYWDAAGTFAEIPRPGSHDPDLYLRWKLARRHGGSFGVARPDALAAPAGEV
jgi:radical SAM protein with 4Fe4S-binding SPASM domain